MPVKPRVFVASASGQALRLARAVQESLSEAEVTVWDQTFQLGQNTIDELTQHLKRFDFGVFILAPTDLLTIGDRTQPAPRDNVILELGMFIGRLGKERSFIVQPQDLEIRLPTDLLGVTTGRYDHDRATREPVPALGAACTQIGDAIKQRHRVMTRELNILMTDALETVCRAMSTPITPEKASLRAFIFRKEAKELVCQHFWDPAESDEKIDKTRFRIDEDTAKRVVVVRCFIDNALRRTDRETTTEAPVKRLPEHFKGAKGKIKSSLKYVLAAPIRCEDESVWGVVDFDASNNLGISLLQKEVSNAVMLRLAKHLASILAN